MRKSRPHLLANRLLSRPSKHLIREYETGSKCGCRRVNEMALGKMSHEAFTLQVTALYAEAVKIVTSFLICSFGLGFQDRLHIRRISFNEALKLCTLHFLTFSFLFWKSIDKNCESSQRRIGKLHGLIQKKILKNPARMSALTFVDVDVFAYGKFSVAH